MRRVSLVLLHHPVLDRSGGVITTAVTNLDLHDMARSSRTYGLSDMFVVHPIAAQRELIEKVRDHWLEGSGARRIPDRVAAMELLRVAESFDQVVQAVGGERKEVEVWITSARRLSNTLTFEQARSRAAAPGRPILLLFGTGWGIAPELCDQADVTLEPICAAADTQFNHLSVRAACAISLDRLFGARSAESPASAV